MKHITPETYITPETQLLSIENDRLICESEIVTSPEKDAGWDWNDDNY